MNRSSAALTMPYTVPPGPLPNGGPAGWMAPFDEMFRMAPHRRGAHARQHELGQLERCPHLHLEHHPVVLLGERLDGAEPRDRAVVDEHVDRAELALGLGDEAGAVLGPGEVGGDRHGRAAGVDDRLHGLVDRAFERALAGLGRARRHGDARSLGGEAAGDLGADAAAGAGDDGDPSVEESHAGDRTAT